MRKIDIQNSRDYYKECLDSAMRDMIVMTQAFKRRKKSLHTRIKELETKLQGAPCARS